MISRVCWNITNRCNDNCAFCFRDQLSSELNLNQNKMIANKLIASGIKHISFSGGEALLYEGLLDLVKLFSLSKIEITLISNSILLDSTTIDEYSKYINWIALPIDTFIGNRNYSRNKNHLDNLLQLLSYLEKKKSLNVKINTVVSHINYNELSLIYSKLISNYHCIKRWNLFEFTPLRGNSIDHMSEFLLLPDEDKLVCDYLHSLQILKKSDLSIKYKHKSTITNSYFVISPNGDVYTKDSFLAGNILTDDISSIYSRLKLNEDVFIQRTVSANVAII